MKNSRFAAFYLSLFVFFLSILGVLFFDWPLISVILSGTVSLLGVHDLKQKKHSILRNYPIIGHFRYLIESISPELRQYIVESDNEKTPFSRAQRSVVYQRAKGELDSTAFGTKEDVMRPGHEWMNHSIQPSKIDSSDFLITVGPERSKPYKMSVFNISAMSFGSLSANAIRALNAGAKKGGFAHDTGEGSVSPYHLENQGDLIWEIGSGYFGCRDEKGNFSPEAFRKTALLPSVKMIEIKLSQGAKPGHGGVLPAAKVTPEIAQTRGVPLGVDCVSPASHSAFSTPIEMMAFISRLRELSDDKPVGFKLCIGHPWEFFSIAKAMVETGIYPDFIVVDGSEGGTGAAPLEFADHMGVPLQEGLLLVHNTLVGLGIREKIKIGASGKIITAFDMARTFALGADWVNSARGFLFSLGCIQALSCNSGRCPSGIATQDPQRQKALVVEDKTVRVFNFHRHSLEALKELLQAVGVNHPDQLRPFHIVKRLSETEITLLSTVLEFLPENALNNGEY
jgi:glutamate synthase domain-containing protein 2